MFARREVCKQLCYFIVFFVPHLVSWSITYISNYYFLLDLGHLVDQVQNIVDIGTTLQDNHTILNKVRVMIFRQVLTKHLCAK